MVEKMVEKVFTLRYMNGRLDSYAQRPIQMSIGREGRRTGERMGLSTGS